MITENTPSQNARILATTVLEEALLTKYTSKFCFKPKFLPELKEMFIAEYIRVFTTYNSLAPLFAQLQEDELRYLIRQETDRISERLIKWNYGFWKTPVYNIRGPGRGRFHWVDAGSARDDMENIIEAKKSGKLCL